MADVLTGRCITLGSGTLGLVLSTPIIIDKIRVTWSGASAGLIRLQEVDEGKGPVNNILHCTTLALASGNIGLATQEFDMGKATFQGLWKTTMTGCSAEMGVQIQLL